MTSSKKEFLEVGFPFVVFATRVEVVVASGGRSVVSISGRDAYDRWKPLWKPKSQPFNSGVISADLERCIRTNAIRVDMDTRSNTAWTQVDGIRLIGGTDRYNRGFCATQTWVDELPRPVELMASIGTGIEIRRSTLNDELGKDVGNGLFAKWDYTKGDFITEYDGVVIHTPRCAAYRELSVNNAAQLSTTSHHRRIEGSDWVIKGLQDPIMGRGGGSFANDPSVQNRSKLNARIVTTKCYGEKEIFRANVTDNAPGKKGKKVTPTKGKAPVSTGVARRGHDQDHTHEILPVVALQALTDIKAGEEIFVDYKAPTRKRLDIQKWSPTDYLFVRPKKSLRKAPQNLVLKTGPPPTCTDGIDAHGLDGQWIHAVVNYSSEYFDLNYKSNGHEQLIGPPKVYPKYGDHPGAWAPATRMDSFETLEFRFATPVYITGIDIYETQTPGCVTKIYAKASNDDRYTELYSGRPHPDDIHKIARIFRPSLIQLTIKCDHVLIEMDRRQTMEWAMIDCVKLRGSLLFNGPAFSPFLSDDVLESSTDDHLREQLLKLSPVPLKSQDIKGLSREELIEKLRRPDDPDPWTVEETFTLSKVTSQLTPFRSFCKDNWRLIRKEVEKEKGDITWEEALKVMKLRWESLPQTAKKHHERLAELDKYRYDRDLAEFQKTGVVPANFSHVRPSDTEDSPMGELRPVSKRGRKKRKVAEASEETNCKCGQRQDNYEGKWIQCEKCGGWSHQSCEGLDLDDLQAASFSFVCTICKGDGVDVKIDDADSVQSVSDSLHECSEGPGSQFTIDKIIEESPSNLLRVAKQIKL